MPVRIHTQSICAALVGAVALLGACSDTSVTRPADRSAETADPLFIAVRWTRTDLPFAPAAINAAGVIVGTNGTEAVRWRNGIIDTLPHLAGLAGPYSAADVTPNGLVLGSANGHVLYWFQDGVQPVDATSGSPYAGSLYPVAMNDSRTIVALSYAYPLAPTTVRWTYPGQWVDVGAGYGISGFDQTIVRSLNAAGQAAGYRYIYNHSTALPVRWGPSGGPVPLSAPIDANGEASGRGLSIDGGGNVFGFTASGPTLWSANGSRSVIYGLPAQPSQRSDAGRYVGAAYNNGVQQVFTSFNGALTWLAGPDATTLTPIDVNSCGAIVATRATSPTTGALWRRTGISVLNTCDTQPVLNPGLTLQ